MQTNLICVAKTTHSSPFPNNIVQVFAWCYLVVAVCYHCSQICWCLDSFGLVCDDSNGSNDPSLKQPGLGRNNLSTCKNIFVLDIKPMKCLTENKLL